MRELLMLLLVACVVSIFCSQAQAQLDVKARIAYQDSEGQYSDYYTRDIQIITGSNLVSKTSDYSYDSYSDYALIWFGQNEVAIVEVEAQSSFAPSSVEGITRSSFRSHLQFFGYNYQGQDQNGTKWKMCFASDMWQMLCD